MRTPSTHEDLHAWHSLAVSASRDTPRSETELQCGWYKMRHVKGGPWVPVRVYVEQHIDEETGELTADEVFCMEIEGIEQDDPFKFWTHLKPITQAEFDHLTDYVLRDTRMADTRKRIDLSLSPTLPQGAI